MMNRWRVVGPASALLALLPIINGRVSGAAADAPPAPGRQTAGYVGVAECTSCHELQARGYRGSPHARAWDARAPAAAQGCETCHGPGRAHVDDPGAKGAIRNFLVLAPREVSDVCTSCHNREVHAQWQGSTHDSRNITCITCHSVHTPKSEKAQLKRATVVEVCAQCHRDKAAKLQRSAHMPVREGKMDCSSCHNQHGSTNVRLLRTGNTVVELCVSCHAEKRGPFLWDHPPVRETCVTCHDPHGSSNDRLLVSKVPMLCQRCHIGTRHPSTVYDQVALTNRSNRLVNRGCLNCHSNIHGSNHPSGQFFQR
jgi:DmsE family decaheme c-type cytochrome